MTQAAYYSAKLTYLNAVKAAKTTDSDKVIADLHKAKIDDMFTFNGKIRADGPSAKLLSFNRVGSLPSKGGKT